jgi:hypothetical protein
MRSICFAVLVLVAAGVAPARAQSLMGITATGKQVRVAQGGEVPWKKDVLKWVPPEYPNRDRYIGNAGSGLYRLVFDPKSGVVSKVETVRANAYPSLNDAAITSLKGWRIRPGSWRAFETTVTYHWSPTRGEALSYMRGVQAEEEKRKAAKAGKSGNSKPH